ncbi:MAG: anaerobic ribonucleoside-triphosphate reductase activating protein [Candidatus Methanospirareceae archaeon]
MKVNLGGIVNISTVDWHGKVSMVIFLRGCPFRCVYCQNYNLLRGSNYEDIAKIEKEVEDVGDFIDAIVLSGGEPFMQPLAIERISEIARKRSLLIAAQTNGYYPFRIKEALEKKLIDKIFLDVKAPLSDETLYRKLTKVKDAAEKVRMSLEVCKNAGIDLEVVTTLFRDFIGLEEARRIARELREIEMVCTYILQQGRPEHAPEEEIKNKEAFSRDELVHIAKEVKAELGNKIKVKIRTKERGEEVL